MHNNVVKLWNFFWFHQEFILAPHEITSGTWRLWK